ncbi:MAG: RNA polymerase sigma factor [Phycisphaerae bacterium]
MQYCPGGKKNKKGPNSFAATTSHITTEAGNNTIRECNVSLSPPSEEQVRRWYPRLFATALRLTGNEADAADLTQQTFCSALDKWHSFDGRCLATTWLHGILMNRFRDWLRGRTRKQHRPLDVWALPSGSCADPVEL